MEIDGGEDDNGTVLLSGKFPVVKATALFHDDSQHSTAAPIAAEETMAMHIVGSVQVRLYSSTAK